MNILILGDIALHKTANTSNEISIPKQLDHLFEKCDLIIGNVEYTIDTKSYKNGGPLLIGAEDDFLLLKKIKLKIALLANNHTFDSGFEGFERVINILTKMKVQWVGAGRNIYEARKPLVLKQMGLLIYNYAEEGTHPIFATKSHFGVNPYIVKNVIDDLENYYKEQFYKIVLVHAGCQHYRFPEPRIRKDAQTLIERGADLVVYNHAHVIQGHERWRGKFIHYGLGNCFFGNILEKTPKGIIPRRFSKAERESQAILLNTFPSLFSQIKLHTLVQIKNILQFKTSKIHNFLLIKNILLKLPYYSKFFIIYRFWREFPVRSFQLIFDIIKRRRKITRAHILRAYNLFKSIVQGKGDL